MKLLKILLAVALFSTVVACQDDEATKQMDVKFLLTDAPSSQNFQEVNIEVKEVYYSVSGENWVQLPITQTVYNLLDLTNGLDTLLANIRLDAGTRINQMRLVLGTNNTIKLADGTIKTLETPSAATSGLKVNIHQSISTESGYAVMIDFDADRSIVEKGNGDYSLKPVIRAYIVQNTSYIDGYIIPPFVQMNVFVVSGLDTVSTVSDVTLNNYFKLHGLNSGTYSLQFREISTNIILKDTVINIIGGTNVRLGEIVFPVIN